MKKLTIEDLKEMDQIDIERAYRAAACFKAQPADYKGPQYPEYYAIACDNIKLIDSFVRNRNLTRAMPHSFGNFEPPYDAAINGLASKIYKQNVAAGWWTVHDKIEEMSLSGAIDKETSRQLSMNLIAGKIALMHSELSESLEGMRKDLMDDHLTHRPMIEVEFADAIIRILDTAAHLGLDVGGAIMEKIEYNKNRADHKVENREKEGGKKI